MRDFKPAELNQLIKYKVDPYSIDQDDHTPVQYITGFSQFYGREFQVTPDVLIPRVESEGLIDIALDSVQSLRAIRNKKRKVVFADIGTGSGILGITYALELQKRNIKYRSYLVDISDKALNIAKQNQTKLISSKDFVYIESDLFKNFKSTKLDIIFANLPYIPSSRIPNLETQVHKYEPKIALDGGKYGLDQISKILVQATKYLRKDGTMILEVDDTHDDRVIKNNGMKKYFKRWKIKIQDDLYQKNRYWICRLRD